MTFKCVISDELLRDAPREILEAWLLTDFREWVEWARRAA